MNKKINQLIDLPNQSYFSQEYVLNLDHLFLVRIIFYSVYNYFINLYLNNLSIYTHQNMILPHWNINNTSFGRKIFYNYIFFIMDCNYEDLFLLHFLLPIKLFNHFQKYFYNHNKRITNCNFYYLQNIRSTFLSKESFCRCSLIFSF